MNWAILIREWHCIDDDSIEDADQYSTVGVIALGASAWWIVDAHKWFTGPIRTINEFEKEAGTM
jgi:hypothetical protein